MKRHFVEFYIPGIVFSEILAKSIRSWNTKSAIKMVDKIKERYGATPYGFKFITRERNDNELDSKITKRSHMYYL